MKKLLNIAKKAVIVGAVIVEALGTLTSVNIQAKNKTTEYRTQSGVYYTDNTIETEDGNLWRVTKGSCAYKNGTKVTVKFDTRNTKKVTDDRIVKVTAKNKDLELVNKYLRTNYNLKKYKVRYAKNDQLTEKTMINRANKKIIYIEVTKSISCGNGYGKIDGKWRVAYNKKVAKGKKVTSYAIYNPHTNYIDDVVAVIDNGMIR